MSNLIKLGCVLCDDTAATCCSSTNLVSHNIWKNDYICGQYHPLPVEMMQIPLLPSSQIPSTIFMSNFIKFGCVLCDDTTATCCSSTNLVSHNIWKSDYICGQYHPLPVEMMQIPLFPSSQIASTIFM